MLQKGLIPILLNDNIPIEYKNYVQYVVQQGGTVQNAKNTLDWVKLLKSIGAYNNTQLMISGNVGVTIDPNAPGDTISKAFSADPLRNNLVQATKANQPLRVGQVWGIAEGMYNGNGASRFMTHPTITFGANDAWSLTVCVNFNGTAAVNTIAFGDLAATKYVYFRVSNNNRIYVLCNGTYFFSVGSVNQIIGKNTVVHIVANGIGGLACYINGVALTLVTSGTDTRFTFSRNNLQDCPITHNAYRIQSGALTASQVDAEAALLSSQYPAIPSVTIGTQTWAVRNFDAVCTPMGNVIPEVTDNAAWAALTTPAWCHYNNDSTNGSVYGKLYNQYAVDLLAADIATYNAANPSNRWGWHIPTQAEWTTLHTYLGGASVAGGKLKQTGLLYWANPNVGATNESRFTALGGGRRLEATGQFTNLSQYASFWSTTPNWSFLIDAASTALLINAATLKPRGCSIRLIKD